MNSKVKKSVSADHTIRNHLFWDVLSSILRNHPSKNRNTLELSTNYSLVVGRNIDWIQFSTLREAMDSKVKKPSLQNMQYVIICFEMSYHPSREIILQRLEILLNFLPILVWFGLCAFLELCWRHCTPWARCPGGRKHDTLLVQRYSRTSGINYES